MVGALDDGRTLYARARHGRWRIDVAGETVDAGRYDDYGELPLALLVGRLAAVYGAGALTIPVDE